MNDLPLIDMIAGSIVFAAPGDDDALSRAQLDTLDTAHAHLI